MIKEISKAEYLAVLRSLGIVQGDILLLHSRLFTLGNPEGVKSRNDHLEFYLRGLLDVVGNDGTLVALTSFEDYGRYETPFVLEKSPSRAGVLSECIRQRSDAVRWLHPLFSLCAIGKRAREICAPGQTNAFGYNSAWDRLPCMNAKMIFLGVTMGEAMTFAHYIEQRHGVPYTYTKLYQGEVWADNKKVNKPFTASVRYLDFGIVYNLHRLEVALVSAGVAHEKVLGQDRVQVASCRDTLEIGARCLDQDLYFFLEQPPRFRYGEIPMDGPAGEAPEQQRVSLNPEGS